MTSSVARPPPSDEWHDPVRLSAAVFGPHGRSSFSPAYLRKVLAHQPQRGDGRSSSSSPSYSSSSSPAAVFDSVDDPNEDAAKRQLKILDPWAARQAREMVKAIERQADEAGVSVLTTTSRLIPSRVKSLFRDTSPPMSESPSGSVAASPSSEAGDASQSVRASFLIQMWRELESEGGLTPRNRPASNGRSTDNINAAGFSRDESTGINCAGLDESDAFGEWNSDTTTTAPCEPVNCSSSLNESEKGRVGNIVKMLTSPKSISSLENENKWFVRETPSSNKSSRQENPEIEDRIESMHRTVTLGLSRLRLRKRRDMKDFIARVEKERQSELVALAERQCVSRFGYRSQLQTMARHRSLQRQPSITLVSDQPHDGDSISLLREKLKQWEHNSEDGRQILESASCIEVQFSMDAAEPSFTLPNYQFTTHKNQHQETVSPTDLESPPEANSTLSRSHDLQEGNRSVHGSWDERNLWVSNLDLQGPTNSSNGWQGEVVIQGVESHSPQNDSSWTDEPSNSGRQWRVSRRPACHDWLPKFADNVDIMDLLERRRVSTSLESDFCDKMNQLISSFLHKGGRQCFDEDHLTWQQNDDYKNNEQVVSVSSSLVPLQRNAIYQPAENCHESSHNADMEALRELRSDMDSIREQISELRKLVLGCMESKDKLEHSIKQDILEAIRQSFGTEIILHPSRTSPERKGRCSICYEMHVDSVFYRCGHMCTCFTCAREILHSSRRCPICQSPILDVVRACPDAR